MCLQVDHSVWAWPHSSILGWVLSQSRGSLAIAGAFGYLGPVPQVPQPLVCWPGMFSWYGTAPGVEAEVWRCLLKPQFVSHLLMSDGPEESHGHTQVNLWEDCKITWKRLWVQGSVSATTHHRGQWSRLRKWGGSSLSTGLTDWGFREPCFSLLAAGGNRYSKIRGGGGSDTCRKKEPGAIKSLQLFQCVCRSLQHPDQPLS